MADDVAWNSPTLNKGQSMASGEGATLLTVEHVDRTIDPYLAGVIHEGRIVYSGLHSTLSDARRTCTKKAALLD